MFNAIKKREENIVEYILYMWQIEDLIRSCQFNMPLIEEKLIEPTNYSAIQKKQLKSWYLDLMYIMERENVQEKGHIPELVEIQSELEQLHSNLLTVFQTESYQNLYKMAFPYIKELKKKSNDALEKDVETCLEFMYGTLLLRLQKKTISPETLEALKHITQYIYALADKFKDRKSGFLNLPNVQKN